MEKLLFVSGSMNQAGQEAFIMNIIRHLNKKYDIHIIVNTKENFYENELIFLGVKIHTIQNSQNLLSYLLQVNKIMRTFGPFKIIHAHCFHFSCFSLIMAKINRIPIRICHSHNSGIEKKNLFGKLYINLAKKVILFSTNKFLACSYNAGKTLYGKNFESFTVLENAVDCSLFTPNKEDHSNINVLQIGRFEPVKNHIKTVNIWKEFTALHPNSKLYFAGTGALMNEMENRVLELGLNDSVVFLGAVKEIYKTLASIDVVIMPSLFEGIPFALIEAQASGTQCLVSSNIDKAVDLDIGLVTFLDLNMNNSIWASNIYNLYLNKVNLDYDYINTVMKESNYNLENLIKKIEKIYNEEA